MESNGTNQAPISSTLPEHAQTAARHDTSTDLEAQFPSGHGGKVSHWQAFGRAVRKLHLQYASARRSGSAETQAALGRSTGRDTNRSPSSGSNPSLDQAGQACFLCLKGKRSNNIAIQIPCFRSRGDRRLLRRIRKNRPTGSAGFAFEDVYDDLEPSESDSIVYKRMVDKCFEYHGSWKRWLPFYGITDVREVEFTFLRPKDQDGTFAIHVSPMDREEIEKRVQHDLKLGLCLPNGSDDPEVCSADYHNRDCLKDEVDGFICPYERFETAKRQHNNLKLLGQLRDCARDTTRADAFKIFDNMVLGSHIYDLHKNGWKANYADIPQHGNGYVSVDEHNGLECDLGWQTDRIMAETPIPLTWVWVILSCIWLAVIACGRPTGNWEMAMTMGSLLMSSCLLFLQYVGKP